MQKEYFIKQLESKVQRIYNKGFFELTDFLDPAEEAEALRYIKKNHKMIQAETFGGFQEAERKRMLLAPPGYEIRIEDFDIQVIEATISEMPEKIGHRDFLGAIMGSGIRREKTGDIIILGKGAAILADTTIAAFIADHFPLIRNYHFSINLHTPQSYTFPEINFIEKVIMVPSLRLDAFIQKACHLSRSESQKMIESGKVKVNHIHTEKTDFMLTEPSVISVRTKGRIVLQEIQGKTKKDNIRVLVKIF